MKKERVFATPYGFAFQVRHRKSAVFLELVADEKGLLFRLDLDAATFQDLLAHLEACSAEAWPSLTIKEADSDGNDYCEYYSRKHDNNGYLEIKENGLMVARPTTESRELYQFNKAKMGTFLYDLRKKVQAMQKG